MEKLAPNIAPEGYRTLADKIHMLEHAQVRPAQADALVDAPAPMVETPGPDAPFTLVTNQPGIEEETVLLKALEEIRSRNLERSHGDHGLYPYKCLTIKMPAPELRRLKAACARYHLAASDVPRFLMRQIFPLLADPNDTVRPVLEGILAWKQERSEKVKPGPPATAFVAKAQRPGIEEETVLLRVLEQVKARNLERSHADHGTAPFESFTFKLPQPDLVAFRAACKHYAVATSDLPRFLVAQVIGLLNAPTERVRPILEEIRVWNLANLPQIKGARSVRRDDAMLIAS